ncbi:MAG: AAA family ATPase [Thermodesulfobacteriota bacterium]|jgi:chromosome partitioning protein
MDEINKEKRARVIAVGNQKGGVGKSTLSVHLATALGEIGKKCLLWDLDMNRGATLQLGLPAEMPILGSFEVLTGAEDPLEVVVRQGDIEGIDLPQNVELIPARRNLEGIDAVLSAKYKFGNPKDILRPLVDGLRSEYDYVFLDTAPNLTIPTVAAYKAADYFLLSAIPEPLAIEGLNDALADIATVREQGNPSLRLIGVVLSAIKGRSTRLQRELIGYVQETFDKGTDPYIKSYSTHIAETTYICECQKLGKTMFQLYPTHKVTDQFRELAREIEARLNALEGIETLVPTDPQANVEEVVNG